MRPKLNFATAIAAIALFVSLSGSVYAATKIEGKTIRKGSIPGNRVQEQRLTGALVDESTLATVSSATAANEVARADTANRVDRAETADFAKSAKSATTAAIATRTTEVERADLADTASQASDAAELTGGVKSNDLLQRCQSGTVRAAIVVDPSQPTVTFQGTNCAGGIDVRRVIRNGQPQGGEYQVTLGGIEGTVATASAFGKGSEASIAGAGPVFVVKVYSANSGDLIPTERFMVAAF
ncbi:MAG TPA: hypothetical protein VF081_04615 [Solirubrobacterales bacterium]